MAQPSIRVLSTKLTYGPVKLGPAERYEIAQRVRQGGYRRNGDLAFLADLGVVHGAKFGVLWAVTPHHVADAHRDEQDRCEEQGGHGVRLRGQRPEHEGEEA